MTNATSSPAPDSAAPGGTAGAGRPAPSGGSSPRGDRRGFTLAQALFAVAILGLIAGLAVPLASQVLSADRSSRAREQLERIRTALVGPQDATAGRSRPDFGYLGDFGALPDSLDPLLHRGARSSFQISGPARIGVGWRGPYYPVRLLDDTTELRTDPFGRAIRYATADTTVNGETWDAHLRSAGPDGEFGTDDDLIEAIPRSRTTGDLVGVVTDTAGDPVDSIEVGMTFRRDGSLVDTTLLTDSQGEYRLTDLSFGTVAVALGEIGSDDDSVGALEYVSGSASVTTTNNPRVEFSVRNTGTTPIDISGWIATYDDQTRTGNNTIFYGRVDQIEPSNKNLFRVNDNCPGSGDAITFSDIVTVGTGSGSTEPVALGAVRTLAVDAPEVSVEGAVDTFKVRTLSGEGDAKVRFRIRDFATDQNCGGSGVDMTNRDFEISFSDGSIINFTTPSS